MDTYLSVQKNPPNMHIKKKKKDLYSRILVGHGLGWPLHLRWLAGQMLYCSSAVDLYKSFFSPMNKLI